MSKPEAPIWLKDKLHWESFTGRAQWALKFCWLPRRCKISQKLMWLEWAYRGQAVWTGPGDPVIEQHWVERLEYLVAKIKGDVR